MDTYKIEPGTLDIPHPENNSNIWEVIVKYDGSLNVVEKPLNAQVEVLNNNYAIVTLPEENIEKLAEYREVEFIERPKTLGLNQSEALSASCISNVLNDPVLGLDGNGVIIAVLDSGIDYAHKEFLNDDGTTRIIKLWDQTIIGVPPQGFKIGHEYTQSDINNALNYKNTSEQLSIVSSIDTLGHGTAVTSIACGSTIGAAKKASIVVVKIGRTIDHGFATTTELMRGISYASTTAKELNMPIAINISFGTNDGSHDGFSLFERFMDEVTSTWKTNVIVATGNEGDSGKHYSNTIVQGQTIDVEYSVADNLQNLSINLWKNFSDFFTLEIISPEGINSGIIRFSNETRRYIFNSCTLYLSFGQPNYLNPSQEIYLFFEARPSQKISPGIWAIRIFGENIVVGKFNMWLPVTEISGRTYFLSPSVDTSLTIPSTSFGAISVGGYNSLINTIASFSGRGYTRVFENVKPDIVAPAVSINAASPRGAYTPVTGTSFATPIVTGSCALLMQWGIVKNNDQFLYGQKVKAYLRLGAKRQNNIAYPNKQWGYGALCLSQTINYLNQMNVNSSSNGVSRNDTITSQSIKNNNALKRQDVFAMEIPNNQVPNHNNNQANVTNEDYVEFVVRINNLVLSYAISNPNVYLQPLSIEYGILYIPSSLENEFETTSGLQIIQELPKCLGLMGRESLEAAGIINVQNQPYLNLRGNGTLVAIIDTGIDFTNSAFTYEDNTTKIEVIWDQTVNGNAPKGFLFGTEYTKENINNALQEDIPTNILPHRDTNGHGTFLASVAAGREELGTSKIGAAPDCSLIVVKLKEAKSYMKKRTGIDINTPYVYSSTDIMQAIEYVINKSSELNMPISICIGLGTNEGGHDGLSIFEEYISRIAIRNNTVVSCAMGNEGRARRHIMATIPEDGAIKNIEIRVSEGETGFSVFIYATEPDKLSVAITSPTGEFVDAVPVRSTQFFETSLLFEKSQVGVRYVFASEKSATEAIFVRILQPTPGLWTLRIKGDVIINGRFHAWLPISNFLQLETYFLESVADYTITMPATSEGVLSVGAYDDSSDILYVSTSRGPTRLNSQNPTITAPDVNVLGANITMTGTSVAAAICAGACALLLEWAIVEKNEQVFNTTRAKAYLISGATRREALDYPNYQWGYGILDLIAAFGALRIT